MERSKVFISYSHNDREWLEALRVHLAPLEADGSLDVWDDTRIEAGALRRDEIADALAAAKVGVLLVSPDLLATESITQHEVPALLERALSAGVRLLCVYVRPSLAHRRAYTYTDPAIGAPRQRHLTEFQGLNQPDEPLSKLDGHAREDALARIAEGIVTAVRAAIKPVDLRPYLAWLEQEHRYLEVRGMGAKTVEQVELERVYTRLRVVGPRGSGRSRAQVGGDADEQPEWQVPGTADSELAQLLAIHTNLLLIGDPGSGKTTFLRFVALNLARAHLGQQLDDARRNLGLTGDSEPPLPIFVLLEALADFLRKNPAPDLPDDAPEHLFRYLDHALRGFNLGLDDGCFKQRILDGGCFLLLDGFDEVPGAELRTRVGRIVDHVVSLHTRVPNRHMVTARTRAYTHGDVRLGHAFVRADLVDFAPEQVEQFVHRWARALYRVPLRSRAQRPPTTRMPMDANCWGSSAPTRA